ncbi:MAG: AraC family transcriptional regulator [Victivallaceae bacterium]|jgi:AraC-like DNA-binding protein
MDNKQTIKELTEKFPFQLLFADYGNADTRTPVIERNNYEYCTIEYIIEGEGYLECSGKVSHLKKDSLYFLHKHQNHCYWPEPALPWLKIFFIIDGSFMEQLLRIYGLDQIYFVENCSSVFHYFNEVMALCSSSAADKDLRGSVLFHRFIMDLYEIIYAEHWQMPEEINVLKKYLDENTERKVNLDEICHQANRSKPHLIRLFKKFTGSTPYDYLMKKRIEYAKLMLIHSTMPIKEIAGKLQFSDQYYFSNYFKKVTGTSPSEFKRSISK